MTNNFDNWKAGLTVEVFRAFIVGGYCTVCPAKDVCTRTVVRGKNKCLESFRTWAESEYIPPKAEKTKVEQLADLLGVVVGEKFNIRWSGGLLSQCNPCALTAEGYILTADNGRADNLFPALLNGEATIEKIPQQPEEWKPKYGDDFWLVTATGFIVLDRWLGVTAQLANYAFGNCFPTEEAAEAGKADILAKFEAIRREIGE